MPSSRAEVRVVGQKSTSATLRTGLYSTGGDNWPAIDLAHVTFAPAAAFCPRSPSAWRPEMRCPAPAV